MQKCLNQRNEKGERGGRTMWLNQLKDTHHTSGVEEGHKGSLHFQNSDSDIILSIILRNSQIFMENIESFIQGLPGAPGQGP